MKREIAPEVRALLVRQLGKALADAWRRRHEVVDRDEDRDGRGAAQTRVEQAS